MQQARAARELANSFEVVRARWFLVWAPSSTIVISGATACAFLSAVAHLPRSVGYSLLIASAVSVCFANQRYREKAWKRVIEAEAPELASRIKNSRRV